MLVFYQIDKIGNFIISTHHNKIFIPLINERRSEHVQPHLKQKLYLQINFLNVRLFFIKKFYKCSIPLFGYFGNLELGSTQ